MKYLLVVVLAFAATGDSLWAYYREGPKTPPPQDQYRMVRKNRHRPKVCVGNCAVCVEKTCAAQGCDKPKR